MAQAPATASRATRIGSKELIALLSMAIALTALGVDLMLPAFSDMRIAFDLAPDSNRTSTVVTAYAIGLALGTLVIGPISDRVGRKPAINASLGIYLVGAVAAALSGSLALLIASRVLWGIGAAGPRTLAISVVRDLYEGDRMAKTMSFVFAIFIIVPVFAPALGAGIVALGHWRWVFWTPAVAAGAVALWATRLPETLAPANRRTLGARDLLAAARYVFGNRRTVGYMLVLTASYAVFLSWLASSQTIIEDVFDRDDIFPFVFGGLAAVMGAAMLANSRLVGRFGARRVVGGTLTWYAVMSAAFLVLALVTDGTPRFALFVAAVAALLGVHALLIPNANSLAMEPMGEMAGTAAAIVGTVSTGGGALLAAITDRAFDGTVTPLAVAYTASAVGAAAAARWAESDR